jgi:cytochrome P450
VKDIFTGSADDMHGGESAEWLLGPILGWNSLIVLDGVRHRRDRRLLTPPFHGERIQHYGRVMQQITDRVIDAWPVGRPFSIHTEMQAITIDVILKTVFGLQGDRLTRVRDSVVRLLQQANSLMVGSVFVPALRIDLGPHSPWGRFRRAREEVENALSAEISHLRTHGTTGRFDILSMLVDARDEHGKPLTEQELFDEMFTLLMAGNETTATSLAWVFYHALRCPEVLKNIRSELRSIVGNGPLEPEHIGKLCYLDAVIKESARLTPITTDVCRLLKRPMRVGGHDLPAGVHVSASIYLMHRRPDLWPEPDRFDPQRFIKGRPSPYTFFPFGGGERRCIGAAFATYEMKVVLARVLARIDLRAAQGYRMRPVLHTVTIAPSKGLPVVATRRAA